MQLYLNCGGVLADFDKAATELLKMPPRQFEKRFGPPEFWKRLAQHPDFYGSLPLMPDAMVLFEAVRHLIRLSSPVFPAETGQRRRRCGGPPSISPVRGSSPA